MATTLVDVAAHAGVSVQTVSNALNNPALLKADTLARVLAAVEVLGYSPNMQARRLRQRTVSTIGLRIEPLADNIASSLLDRFLHELTAKADLQGQHVVLFTATSDEEEVEKIRGLASGRVADRFMLTSTHMGDARVPALLDAGLPFVTFGRPWGPSPQHSWVDVDGAAGTREATEVLLDAGHRRIGFLGWPEGSGSGDDRRLGWASAMRERLGVDGRDLDALTVRSEDGVAEALAAVAPLLEQGVDALVCASDSLATGAIGALAQTAARVPVIGFDNTSLAAGLGFPSVDQSLGEVAAAALLALDPEAGVTTTLVTPQLVRRDDARWGIAPAADRGSTPS
ncbi:LacI family DNA-binding transcriptional regulator [Agrococcus sp. Marseille-P2731]|uniref:LacI family DNA-binding transcriptional regulator n=1 Tax=Agrococcus sp. Marseille-P2731 TaxID=1841862 RepID=UPI0009315D18|nr:LacI family DNA-binding transcriptional regulator [Agrococcus sp. Marseille-P2731]